MWKPILENAAGGLLTVCVVGFCSLIFKRVRRDSVPASAAVTAVTASPYEAQDADPSKTAWPTNPFYYVALAGLFMLLALADIWSVREILQRAWQVHQAPSFQSASGAWGGIFILALMRLYVTQTSLEPVMATWPSREPRTIGILQTTICSFVEQVKQVNWLKVYGWASTSFWLWFAVPLALARHT